MRSMDESYGAHVRRGLDWKRFCRRNTDMVFKLFAVPLCLIGVLVLCLVVKHNTKVQMEAEFAEKLTQVRIQTEQETAERIRAQYGIYETGGAGLLEQEATALAKMLYAYQYNTDQGITSAVWCALNRVDSRNYPNTVEEVCSQEQQWMGWSEDNPVIDRLYNIAYEQLESWHKGVHLIGPDFLFLDWNSKEITLRSTFEGGNGCHYWYETDWRE